MTMSYMDSIGGTQTRNCVQPTICDYFFLSYHGYKLVMKLICNVNMFMLIGIIKHCVSV